MAHPRLPQLTNWSPVVSAEKVFTPQDCGRVLSLRTDMIDGKIVDSDAKESAYRSSQVCWIRPSAETEWVFAKALDFIQHVNANCYHMDLAGYTEPLQVSEYGTGQFYDWHLDLGNEGHSIRKLSFIVQLSEDKTYDGGSVEMLYERDPKAAPREQGTMIVFPSYLLHRVSEVTRGTRLSLVGWIGGPPYR